MQEKILSAKNAYVTVPRIYWIYYNLWKEIFLASEIILTFELDSET